MSFFPTQYKPLVRQEGFSPPDAPFDLPDAFRPKFPAHDFGDELATLMVQSPPPLSHERSTQDPDYDDRPYRHAHNIFDISAPQTMQSFPAHFSLPPPSHLHPSLDHAPPHSFGANFNSTLPALNSSLRFEPDPHDPANNFDFSPAHRSRSRSNGPGPTRTARQKRNSVSGTSPPPRPGIVIPGRAINVQGWFGQDFLPTPDSVNSWSNGLVGSIGVSPKEMGVIMKDEDDVAAKQAALASEKRRRRRESHNAVERRRRDNINEKISELATLIPECMLDGGAPASTPTPTESDIAAPPEPPTPGGNGSGTPEKEEAAGVVKANKGMILRKSVEYIRYLQQLVTAQASRNRDLEQQLSAYRAGGAPDLEGVGVGVGDMGGSGGLGDMGGGGGMGDMVLHEELLGAGGSGELVRGVNGEVLRGVSGEMVGRSNGEMMGRSSGEMVGRSNGEMTGRSNGDLMTRRSNRRSGSRFRVGELASVEEGGDVEMDGEGGSPLSEEGEEEERGRRGRDGRVGGVGS